MDEKLKETGKVEETVKTRKSSAPHHVRKTAPPWEKKKELKYPKMANNGKNSPMIGMNGYNLQPGDNTNILNVQIKLFNLPDIDMTDVDQVAQRLSEYFAIYGEADLKPTVAGMAIALNGHSRQWLYAVTHDTPLGGKGNVCTLPRDVTNCIKKAYSLLSNMWEVYMSTGKINPVTGIFLGKNNYDYQDKVEHVVTPNIQQDDFSADDIRSRYSAPEIEDKQDDD